MKDDVIKKIKVKGVYHYALRCSIEELFKKTIAIKDKEIDKRERIYNINLECARTGAKQEVEEIKDKEIESKDNKLAEIQQRYVDKLTNQDKEIDELKTKLNNCKEANLRLIKRGMQLEKSLKEYCQELHTARLIPR